MSDLNQSLTGRNIWLWCALPAITMSLGWGERGSIGGGSLGAMIPGAMIALVLCILLGRGKDAGIIAGLGAVGVGFGGQETYGQTVGLILLPDTFWWATLGFAVKGAVWGLLGGAFLGIALTLERFTRRQVIIGFALMVVGTWIGWKFLNHPKLIYFSNRIDRPREELWAGLWLGGLFLLAWLRARVPSLFALYGAIGGGIGFAFGATLQPWGKGVWAEMPIGWWKAMELTFGALLGLSYSLCAWKLRAELSTSPREERVAPASLVLSIVAGAIAIALAILAGQVLPSRFDYTIAGAVLAALILYSETLGWQTAITATYAAFAVDFLKHQTAIGPEVMWPVVVVTTVIVSVIVSKYPRAQPMLVLLTWTAILSEFRYLLPPSKMGVTQITMVSTFILMSIIITLGYRTLNLRSSRQEPAVVGA